MKNRTTRRTALRSILRVILRVVHRVVHRVVRLLSSKRFNALALLASLTLTLILSAVSAATGPAHDTSAAVPTTAEAAACRPFTRHRDHSWYEAQQHLNTLPAYSTSTRSERDLLDSDTDGYACEHLAASTAAAGEPACTGLGWWRDCSGRTMYRTVTHLTSYGDAPALRAALLDVYLSSARNPTLTEQSNVADLLAAAYAHPAPCQRTEMQAFIRNRVAEQEMSAAFTTSLGLGEKAIDRATRRNPAAPYAMVVEEYLNVAGKAFDTVIEDARYAAAVSSAERVATC